MLLVVQELGYTHQELGKTFFCASQLKYLAVLWAFEGLKALSKESKKASELLYKGFVRKRLRFFRLRLLLRLLLLDLVSFLLSFFYHPLLFVLGRRGFEHFLFWVSFRRDFDFLCLSFIPCGDGSPKEVVREVFNEVNHVGLGLFGDEPSFLKPGKLRAQVTEME